MTRIFEALKKSQGRAAALPFPPVEIASPRPAAVPRPAASVEHGPTPRLTSITTAPLPAEVARELTALRISVESTLDGRKTRSLMFVSALAGEGVSTVARQFASVVAADGRGRCLLLDLNAEPVPAPAAPRPADVRANGRATGARGAGVDSPAGRGGHPMSIASLSDESRRSGGWTPSGIRAFLSGTSAQFDWVIVDGPPVLQAPESVDLAPLVDGVVLVVRSGHAKRPVVLRAADLLRKSGVRILGCVLNRRRLEIPDFIYRRI